MRIGPFVFRPLLTAAVAAAFAVLLGLGTWQVARLAWKNDLIARTEALATRDPVPLGAYVASMAEAAEPGAPLPEYAHVSVTGGFVTDRTVHVNGTYGGRPGFYVFQPFKPDGPALPGSSGDIILVNRGFVASGYRRDAYELPDAEAMTGLVRYYEGPSLATFLDVPPDPDGLTVYDRRRPTLTRPFRDLAPDYDADAWFAPFYLDSTLPTEVPRGGTTRLDFSNRHLGYAITWYGLAGGLLAVFLLMSRERRRP